MYSLIKFLVLFVLFQVKTDQLEMTIVKGHIGETSSPSGSTSEPGPVCRFVNIELCETSPQKGAKGTQATLLLENPRGDYPISVQELQHQVNVWGISM